MSLHFRVVWPCLPSCQLASFWSWAKSACLNYGWYLVACNSRVFQSLNQVTFARHAVNVLSCNSTSKTSWGWIHQFSRHYVVLMCQCVVRTTVVLRSSTPNCAKILIFTQRHLKARPNSLWWITSTIVHRLPSYCCLIEICWLHDFSLLVRLFPIDLKSRLVSAVNGVES